ncbi:MAG: methylmalonyl-CoA mutase [Elusimicrobia bacterium]|nr:methylmalonyl-CoA mutase [Elusimicrobiota bacterium]
MKPAATSVLGVPGAVAEPTTLSGIGVRREYRPEDISSLDYERDLGDPGHYPFTRGLSFSGYRARPWTMRQFSGHGTAEQTNRRFRYLLRHGQTGLSTAFDLPTLMGMDSDDPRAAGEVGREGVAIDTLEDMEILFQDIRLGEVSTSMTINLPAPILLGMYLAVAERQGVSWRRLRGTLQTDILKEYIAQNEYLYPPEHSLRLVLDTIEFCVREVPRFYPISISGYHIREAGADAVQELAFTLADGREYVRALVRRGLAVDDFAGHLSFFFDSHNYFFEEIAKFRAARRIWARVMREEFGARKKISWVLPMHVQTAGVSLVAQQPKNNLVRTAYQALAAVLGGTQSLHTNSYDEALALPTEEAVTLALRTQQVLAYETGIVHTADPFGGSFYLEALTREVEERALDLMRRIEEQGGVLGALRNGFFHREIADSAYRYEQEMLGGKRRVVGVNVLQQNGRRPPILKIHTQLERRQIKTLQARKRKRDARKLREALGLLQRAASGTENVLPAILGCIRSGATLGEMTQTLKEVFGEYIPQN